MAKWKAEIISPWTVGADGGHKVQVTQEYSVFMSDTTAQPSANIITIPNMMTCWITCEAVVLDALEADGDYIVLWSEEIVEEAF